VDFIITLTYVNNNKLYAPKVIFYGPGLGYAFIAEPGFYTDYPINEAEIYLGRVGVLRCYRTSFHETGWFITFPIINYNFTEIHLGKPVLRSEYRPRMEPIYIYMKKPPSDVLQPFSMTIGIVVGVFIGVGSVLLGIKIREKRAEKK